MEKSSRDIAQTLADNAHAACRHYLFNGRRDGNYWLVGDIHNNPGRSLYLRLADGTNGRGRAGKWTDAGTGEHGDLLDVIAARCHHENFAQTIAEARHFLSLPDPVDGDSKRSGKAHAGSPTAARRLWAASTRCGGDAASAYLHARALGNAPGSNALRFHPRCFYRPAPEDAPNTPTSWPALIAAVTDLDGRVTGVHRTWLDPAAQDKAPVAAPRRAMGDLLGHAVRFGRAAKVIVAGEGLETMLSVREVAPRLPSIAGLSAAHLSAILFPPELERLYVAQDNDLAGIGALSRLRERAEPLGIDVQGLEPRLDDFNSDLVRYGPDDMVRSLALQLQPDDALHYLCRQP